MNWKHLDECLARLDDTRRLLDQIQTDLRGAQEFRDAVFDLLEGTPFGAQSDSLYDGLYGRLRAALAAAPAAAPAPAQAEGIEAKYHELLYAVENKYPGETRHQTALRYIQLASRNTGSANAVPPSAPDAEPE